VGSLIVLVFSLYFIQGTIAHNYIISLSLLLTFVFSFFLVRSIRKEVELRKHIESLATSLQTSNDRLLELDKQKSEFVSFATHQLKSPLAAMRGYASLILEGDYGDIPAQAHEPLNRIFESTKTLANVVEGYLNISRIELGTMKYDFAHHDIRAMVSDVIAELKRNTEKAGITLSFDVSLQDSFVVDADPDKLKQVFMNLIDNSVKYTPSGTVKVSLTKTYHDLGAHILFAVKDTGIGMTEKTIASLFQKFTRAYNANKTNIHGTGLGLYVAKQIVIAHRGRVWAESAGEGKGSQFYVELPSAK
jgi:signal transduction histidine kinase